MSPALLGTKSRAGRLPSCPRVGRTCPVGRDTELAVIGARTLCALYRDMTQEQMIIVRKSPVRALLACVLSVCALAAIAAYELSPETIAEVRARTGRARSAEVASPVVEALPGDPEDLEPTGPAKLRPARTDTRGERRASPRASGRRAQEK